MWDHLMLEIETFHCRNVSECCPPTRSQPLGPFDTRSTFNSVLAFSVVAMIYYVLARMIVRGDGNEEYR